jgi:uncharacterized OB-fold protein
LSEEDDEKNKEKKLASTTGTKRENYFQGSQQGKICPECAYVNDYEKDFCPSCGTPL